MGLDTNRRWLCVWSSETVWEGIKCVKLLKATSIVFEFSTPSGEIVALPIKHLNAKSSNNVVFDWLSDKSNLTAEKKWDLPKFASKWSLFAFSTLCEVRLKEEGEIWDTSCSKVSLFSFFMLQSGFHSRLSVLLTFLAVFVST